MSVAMQTAPGLPPAADVGADSMMPQAPSPAAQQQALNSQLAARWMELRRQQEDQKGAAAAAADATSTAGGTTSSVATESAVPKVQPAVKEAAQSPADQDSAAQSQTPADAQLSTLDATSTVNTTAATDSTVTEVEPTQTSPTMETAAHHDGRSAKYHASSPGIKRVGRPVGAAAPAQEEAKTEVTEVDPQVGAGGVRFLPRAETPAGLPTGTEASVLPQQTGDDTAAGPEMTKADTGSQASRHLLRGRGKWSKDSLSKLLGRAPRMKSGGTATTEVPVLSGAGMDLAKFQAALEARDTELASKGTEIAFLKNQLEGQGQAFATQLEAFKSTMDDRMSKMETKFTEQFNELQAERDTLKETNDGLVKRNMELAELVSELQAAATKTNDQTVSDTQVADTTQSGEKQVQLVAPPTEASKDNQVMVVNDVQEIGRGSVTNENDTPTVTGVDTTIAAPSSGVLELSRFVPILPSRLSPRTASTFLSPSLYAPHPMSLAPAAPYMMSRAGGPWGFSQRSPSFGYPGSMSRMAHPVSTELSTGGFEDVLSALASRGGGTLTVSVIPGWSGHVGSSMGGYHEI